jgi:hypothetical protein
MTTSNFSDSAFAASRAESDSAIATERRMRDGKRLIFIGFTIAVLGIVAYCVVGLSAPTRIGAVSGLGDFVGPSLGVIGVGTLLWLIGSFRFLSAAMDSNDDPAGMDL